MYWFTVGNIVGIVCCILYVYALCIPVFRKNLANSIFDGTIYGDMLKEITGEIEDKDNVMLFLFLFSIFTFLQLLVIFIIGFILSYVLLLIVVLTIFFSYKGNIGEE